MKFGLFQFDSNKLLNKIIKFKTSQIELRLELERL